MPLLDLVLTMLWFFLFVAWIWLLISVYADIFRSDDLGGFGKASVLFALLLPYLGVLVYLIVRGCGMQERSIAQAQQSQRATESCIREVAGGGSPADELLKLIQRPTRGRARWMTTTSVSGGDDREPRTRVLDTHEGETGPARDAALLRTVAVVIYMMAHPGR